MQVGIFLMNCLLLFEIEPLLVLFHYPQREEMKLLNFILFTIIQIALIIKLNQYLCLVKQRLLLQEIGRLLAFQMNQALYFALIILKLLRISSFGLDFKET